MYNIHDMPPHISDEEPFQTQSAIKKYWLEFDVARWKYMFPPFRPSKCDVDGFRGLLPRDLSGSRVAVLGSTPELRDLVVERKGHPFVIDFSQRMISGMLQYCSRAAGSESWCLSDWRALDFPAGAFQWVLGDLILRALPAEEHGGFLEGVARILADSGGLILREHILDESLRAVPVARLLRRARPEDLRDDRHWRVRTHIVSLLMDKYSDPAVRVMKRRTTASKLLEASETISTPDERELLRTAVRFLRTGPDWSISTERQLKDAFSPRFKIMDVLTPHDHPEGRHYPIYSLKKRLGEQ
jgi:hypothetical protein